MAAVDPIRSQTEMKISERKSWFRLRILRLLCPQQCSLLTILGLLHDILFIWNVVNHVFTQDLTSCTLNAALGLVTLKKMHKQSEI